MNFVLNFLFINKGVHMKWLFLILLFSCSSNPNNKNVATESDAKPVSPLTVQPCLCMKIFNPVCADGLNYGNSCEAECHGHKKWTDGPCAQAPKK
jgi:hypothetical protein